MYIYIYKKSLKYRTKIIIYYKEELFAKCSLPKKSRRVVESRPVCMDLKGPYRPDAIRQRDANFQFSMPFNFTIFLCFSNIRNHLSNFNYLVYISCKIFHRSRFYLFLKTENSRRVVDSRSVCVGLKTKDSREQIR